jgi:hypothetical protein
MIFSDDNTINLDLIATPGLRIFAFLNSNANISEHIILHECDHRLESYAQFGIGTIASDLHNVRCKILRSPHDPVPQVQFASTAGGGGWYIFHI